MPTLCRGVLSGLPASFLMATAVLAGEPGHPVPAPSEALAPVAKRLPADERAPDTAGHLLSTVTPTAAVTRPAPGQTLFILEYVSVRLANGMAGFVPGQSVRLVRIDVKTGRLLVTDGRCQVEVTLRQATGDPGVATFLRLHDEAAQRAFEAARDASLLAQAKARRQFEAAKRQMELSQDLYLAGLVKPEPISAQPLRFDPGWKPRDCLDVSYERHGDPYGASHEHLDVEHWKAPVSVDGLSHFVNGFNF